MIDAVRGIFAESVSLFLRMSPYLLFGFLFAGLLHVFISLGAIARHLGKRNLASIAKSVVLGIPLPLCSCGVIPAAVLLKKKGASRGSVISFLISTPITGVDSIFATYALLGPLFAIYRVFSSALTALVAGVLANFLTVPEHSEAGHSEHDGCAGSFSVVAGGPAGHHTAHSPGPGFVFPTAFGTQAQFEPFAFFDQIAEHLLEFFR